MEVRLRSTARNCLLVLGAVSGLTACDTGVEPLVTRPSPLAGVSFHVPYPSDASRQAEEWRAERPLDAAAMDRIASQPRAVWLADADPLPELASALDEAEATGTIPVFAAYFIPQRDCGTGGAASAAEYGEWIRSVASALAGRAAVVVLEPDALGHLECAGVRRAERLAALRDAVQVLGSSGLLVYLDGGHPDWLSVTEAAERLRAAGVDEATGFSLNVANFVDTRRNVEYGQAITARIGPTGFIIDTSRNGAGAAPDGEWCNPPDRRLGPVPTSDVDYPAVDALLWIKRPGESDGTCNGGPPAGEWWPEYALMLAG